MLEIKFTASMKRDLKRLRKQGKDMEKLRAILLQLAAGQSLPPNHRDHPLAGDKKACRECHVEPDWLLVYQIQQAELVLLAIATGSHADLFGM